MIKPAIKEKFIELVAQGMFQNEAYKLVIGRPVTEKYAKVSGYRWAKQFAKEIESKRQAFQRAKDAAMQSQSVQAITAQLLTVADVDAKLSAIINGKPNIIRHPETSEVLMIDNTTKDKLRAIDIFYRRHGHYPQPVQINQQFNLPQPVIELVNSHT